MRIVVTNNPLVRDRLPESEFHDTDFIGVLKLVRDRIHIGHKLLTHPLSGSIKPGETPYKTVVISAEKSCLDLNALSIIEGSIQTCQKFVIKGNWGEKALADFQLIDYDLVFNK